MAKKHDITEETPETPAEPARYTLIRSGAFGYGTRPRGFVFATETEAGIAPADGVSEGEVAEIINNPEFFEVR